MNVTFRRNRTLATRDEVVRSLAAAVFQAGAEGGEEAALTQEEVRGLVLALDQFTDAYEFRVEFLLLEVNENRTIYEDSTEQVVG